VRHSWIIVLAALALLPACGGDGSDRPATVTGAEPVTTREAAPQPPPEEPREPPLALEEVASGFSSPVHVTGAPGQEGRLYVVEQEGRIVVLEGGGPAGEPFLDIRRDVGAGGERGLLSVAFHPDYAENGRLYVNYTNRSGDTRVVEYRANDERTAVEPGTARELLAVEQPYSNHNGGQLAFGPDGLLYVGMGDGGSGGDPESRAQDLGDRLGKLLRIDVDTEGADWEIAAYGLRNPWRFSFDRETGDLHLADVGENTREEVNALAWPANGLVNFGWPAFEGDTRFDDRPLDEAGRLVEPVRAYGRSRGCSVTGGFAYRGEAMPGLAGRAFYGDYCSGIVWSYRFVDGEARGARREPFQVPGLASFGEDTAGELYLVSHEGTIFRLVEAG
jgi:glucose/arabinose dehydrogenase